MRTSVFAVAAALTLCGNTSEAVALTGSSQPSSLPPEVVENSHVIFLKPRANETNFKAWVQQVADENRGATIASVDAPDVPAVSKAFTLGPADQVVITGKFDDQFVAEAKARPDVADVFPNLVHRILGVQANPPNAGLPQISSRSPASDYFFPDSSGGGVTVYVVDTGIRATHSDFGNRATLGFTAVDGTLDASDDNGHGTHVGGIVGGLAHGVAKNANLVGVKVCSSGGRCTTEDILEGISFVISDAQRRGKPGKSVANLSIGGPIDQALDQAVQSAIDSGIAFTVAAGNQNNDACNSSPARVPGAITVGALDRDGVSKAAFSNSGNCVDVFAPGVAIRSASNVADDSTTVLSGTSMSSPFAAGTLALFAGQGEFSVQELTDAITNLATKGAIRNLQEGTPNLILFNGGETGVAPDAPSPTPTTPAEITEAPTATSPTPAATTIPSTTTEIGLGGPDVPPATTPEVPTSTNSVLPTPAVPARPQRPPPRNVVGRPIPRPRPFRRPRPVSRPRLIRAPPPIRRQRLVRKPQLRRLQGPKARPAPNGRTVKRTSQPPMVSSGADGSSKPGCG